jgi:GH18 family chitinase
MSVFAVETVQLLKTINGDGLDIDWEVPVWSTDAAPTDRVGLINLCRVKDFKYFYFQLKKLFIRFYAHNSRRINT